MYAIVDIAGQQFKVEKDQKLFVHRLEEETGANVSFGKVLLIEKDSKIVVGSPVISGAAVSAKVLDQVKGDKVLVFKKKRRKGYKKLNGHRQQFTQIQITEIVEKGAKATATKPAVEKKATPEADTAKPDSKKKGAEEKKPAEIKETVAKKPAAQKRETTEKKAAAPKKESTAKKGTTAKKPAAPKKEATAKKETTAKKPAAPKKEATAKKETAPKKETAAKKQAAPGKNEASDQKSTEDNK